MKKMICTLAMAAVISLPAFAQEGQKQGDNKGQKMDGMMMSHGNKMPMHEHMKKMHDQMTTIKAETDPEKRQTLIKAHMQSMQEGLQMMNGAMRMGKANGGTSKLEPIDMTQRMDMMEEHMGMMQMMMGQMLEHESESQKVPVRKLNK